MNLIDTQPHIILIITDQQRDETIGWHPVRVVSPTGGQKREHSTSDTWQNEFLVARISTANDDNNNPRLAETHWFEAHSIDHRDFKRKRWLEAQIWDRYVASRIKGMRRLWRSEPCIVPDMSTTYLARYASSITGEDHLYPSRWFEVIPVQALTSDMSDLVTVHLNAISKTAIRDMANAKGISMSALVREWIDERLDLPETA